MNRSTGPCFLSKRIFLSRKKLKNVVFCLILICGKIHVQASPSLWGITLTCFIRVALKACLAVHYARWRGSGCGTRCPVRDEVPGSSQFHHHLANVPAGEESDERPHRIFDSFHRSFLVLQFAGAEIAANFFFKFILAIQPVPNKQPLSGHADRVRVVEGDVLDTKALELTDGDPLLVTGGSLHPMFARAKFFSGLMCRFSVPVRAGDQLVMRLYWPHRGQRE